MTMVTGLFNTKDSAERAFQAVIDLGYEPGDINVVMSDEVRQRYVLARDPHRTDLEQAAAKSPNDTESKTWGGPVGGSVGTIAPIVAAVGVLLIPGFGVAAGPLAIALAASAAAGAAMGLMPVLTDWGIPDARVAQYEAGLRAGGVLLGVKAHSLPDASRIHRRWQECGGDHVHA